MSDSASPALVETLLLPAEEAGIAAGSAAATVILSDDEYSRFLLRHKNEIVPILRGLVENVSQITMFFNSGRDMILTSLVSFDDASMILDAGRSEELNRQALESNKLFCVTQLDRVKIQFLLRGLSRIQFEGHASFRAPMPENMLRLQRREYYRLMLPIMRPLMVSLPLTDLAGGKKTLDIQIGDISGGGLALINLPKTVQIAPGVEFPDVRLDLPEVGLVKASLRICSVMETRNRAGAGFYRAGCEFVRLPGTMLTLIQRYIIKIERERKARESGLG